MELEFSITIWKYKLNFDLELLSYHTYENHNFFDNNFTIRVSWDSDGES